MSDAELCAASRAGHTGAFVEIVRRYQNVVCAVAYAVTQQRATSEDLAQETFLLAWRKVGKITDPARLSGWLTGIARNLARHTRRHRRCEALPEDDRLPGAGGNLEEAMIERETRDAVRALLSALPMATREVMVLYYREEQSVARVAERLGISVAATEQRLSRGRRLLRGKVERAIACELSRTQPGSTFTRRVAAAVAVAAPLPTSPNGAVESTVWNSALLHKALAVAAVVIALLTARDFTPESPPAPAASPGGATLSDGKATPPRDVLARRQISGVVIAADSGRAIGDGTVTIVSTLGVASTSDRGEAGLPAVAPLSPAGRFSVDGLEPGAYVAVASAVGYLPARSETISIDATTAGASITLTLTAGGHTVSGIVTDIGGGPIEGARVSAAGTGQQIFSGITNGEGHYQISAPAGSYTLRAWDSDYRPRERRLSLGGSDRNLDFELVPASTISGRVLHHATGLAVADATVSFVATEALGRGFSRRSSTLGESTVTDAAGRFTLRRLAAAEYQLHANADHLATAAPTEVSLGVAESATDVVIVVESAFNISGRIVDDHDPSHGFPDMLVAAITAGGRPSLWARGDRHGRFTLQGVRRTRYGIGAFGPGVVSEGLGATAMVTDGDVEDLELRLERSVRLHGRITPPRAALVRLRRRDGASAGSDSRVLPAGRRSAATGTFTLEGVPTGAWTIVAEADDGSLGELEVAVGPDGLRDVVIGLQGRPSLRGNVSDLTGAAVDNAIVTILPDKSTTTDSNGDYMLVGLDPGAYHLQVSNRDHNKLVAVGTTPADAGTPVQIQTTAVEHFDLTVVLPTGTVTGVVRDHAGVPQRDVWVTLYNAGESTFERDRPPALTDADGRFAFERLSDDRFEIYARANGGAIAKVDDVRPGDDVQLVLKRLGAIEGHVHTAGKPVTRFAVMTARISSRSFVNDDGDFAIDRVRTGRQKLVVTAPEGAATTLVDIEAGGVTEVDIELTRWAAVTGRAISATGEPIAGLSIAASAPGGDPNGAARRVARMTRVADGAQTDASGRFWIEGIGVGRVDVTLGRRHPSSGDVMVGGAHGFVLEGGSTVDLGDVVVLTDDPPDHTDRGTLGLLVHHDHELPRPRDDPRPPALGRPQGPAQLWVTKVTPGSPAAAAGLERGQAINAVNGQTVEALGAATLGAMLNFKRIRAGATYRLEIVDGNRTRTVSLNARPTSWPRSR